MKFIVDVRLGWKSMRARGGPFEFEGEEFSHADVHIFVEYRS